MYFGGTAQRSINSKLNNVPIKKYYLTKLKTIKNRTKTPNVFYYLDIFIENSGRAIDLPLKE